ncbi:MAG: SAM-dependent methyltransferase [Rhodospirillaceae bacterium TMED8]|nr:SAM-dependent methyltransferase [Magnetovibrio sp.]OUT53269.1 MAG: SAM-dependent methyltransferase [Rhodospirillaceae bacterium TMED8]|tara:strand:- start:870 stop:1772 length:903 start_codon:yes stop_codon:yes gene_type:complete
MVDVVNVFDRQTVRRNRDRAAPNLSTFDFLYVETATRLVDRLDDVKRTFPLALDIGCHGGELARVIAGRGGIEQLIACDLSQRMAAKARNEGVKTAVVDEEALPFKVGTFDLILSNLSLHWTNDLPGTLVQMRHALKADGLLLVSMLGGATLRELRDSMYRAEIEIENGLSPRFSPLADVRDLGNLLHRAGFALPVTDYETLTVSYDNPLKLMRDLRGMGENNANLDRRETFSRRDTIMRAAKIYEETYMGNDGRIPATFEVISLTAWAPALSQPKPLPRGSAQIQLGTALNLTKLDPDG